MTARCDLNEIRTALRGASAVALRLQGQPLGVAYKGPRQEPVTRADIEIDGFLRQSLRRRGDGWLSEETPAAGTLCSASRTWIVDPIDGTKEFVQGIPEWCISVALVVGRRPVAAGIANPATGELFLAAGSAGVIYEGNAPPAAPRARLLILASRAEVVAGKWSFVEASAYDLRAVGSIAYKLATVAAGLAVATWTVEPKHDWDIAAGAALVLAAGGRVRTRRRDRSALVYPRVVPSFFALAAASPPEIEALALAHYDSLQTRRRGHQTAPSSTQPQVPSILR